MNPVRTVGAVLLLTVGPLGLGASPARAADAQVVVPGITVHGEVEDGVASLLTEMVLSELQGRHGLRTLAPGDIAALLTLEQQRQLLGCEEDRCMAELAGALDVPWIVAGSIGRLGEIWSVGFSVMDAREVRVLGRVRRQFPRLEDIADALPAMMSELVRALGTAGHAAPVTLVAEASGRALPEDIDAFCREVTIYRARLRRGPHDDGVVESRRRLLTALHVATPGRERSRRQACIEEDAGAFEAELVAARRRAPEARVVRDARLRLADWQALVEASRGVAESASSGPVLPFAVAPPQLDPMPDSVEAYEAAYEAVGPTVARALQAVERGNRRAFDVLFLPEASRHESVNLPHLFRQLRQAARASPRVEVCPFWVLTSEEIAEAARRLEDEDEVGICYRILGEHETSGLVWLRRDGGLWRIHRW
jgi:hypothetical protein